MKIICVGRNYRDHASELNNPVPKSPLIFMKPPSALLINNKPFYIPEFSKSIHYEVELLVKIAKNGRHIQRSHAMSYIRGYGLGIDFTARDLQTKLKEKGHPWELAKGFDNSAAVSKFYPATDFNLKKGIIFALEKNGSIVQQGSTTDMVFSIEDLIIFISQYIKLQVGDILFTGTPSGVGPVAIGDILEGFLEGQKVFTCAIK